MADHIDVKFKSWGNGSVSGPWVRLDLAEEEDLEPLKSQMGKGFHMVLVPIDQGDSTPPDQSIKKAKEEKPLSCQAAMMIKKQSFCDYVNVTYIIKTNLNTIDQWLKGALNIKSKTFLDSPDNTKTIRHFLSIQKEWRHWVSGQGGRY